MDLDRLVRRVSEEVAAKPSRRGFVTTLAVGVGAVLAGLRSPGEEAAARSKGSCCTGKVCGQKHCPDKTKRGWLWVCEDAKGNSHTCQDCADANGEFVCNFSKGQKRK